MPTASPYANYDPMSYWHNFIKTGQMTSGTPGMSGSGVTGTGSGVASSPSSASGYSLGSPSFGGALAGYGAQSAAKGALASGLTGNIGFGLDTAMNAAVSGIPGAISSGITSNIATSPGTQTVVGMAPKAVGLASMLGLVNPAIGGMLGAATTVGAPAVALGIEGVQDMIGSRPNEAMMDDFEDQFGWGATRSALDQVSRMGTVLGPGTKPGTVQTQFSWGVTDVPIQGVLDSQRQSALDGVEFGGLRDYDFSQSVFNGTDVGLKSALANRVSREPGAYSYDTRDRAASHLNSLEGTVSQDTQAQAANPATGSVKGTQSTSVDDTQAQAVAEAPAAEMGSQISGPGFGGVSMGSSASQDTSTDADTADGTAEGQDSSSEAGGGSDNSTTSGPGIGGGGESAGGGGPSGQGSSTDNDGPGDSDHGGIGGR